MFPLDPSKSVRAAQVLNGLEFFWEPINALCRMLTARLEWGVTVNAYITPAAARGFTPHSDHQDVMILQLDGAKHWTVYHRPILNPTAKHKVGRTVSRAIIAGGSGLHSSKSASNHRADRSCAASRRRWTATAAARHGRACCDR